MELVLAGVERPELFALALPDPPVALPPGPAAPAGDSCTATVNGENEGRIAGVDISR